MFVAPRLGKRQGPTLRQGYFGLFLNKEEY